MFLTSKNIPEIQRLFSGKPADIEKLRGADISLTVALFLGISHRSAADQGNRDLADCILRLGLPGVETTIGRLNPAVSQISREPFGAPRFEIYRIGSAEDLLSAEWPLFCDRFRRSFAAGREGKMYRATGSVLGEMGDNVVSHAFPGEEKPYAAVAGFHIEGDTASFCVADAGQGFLKSLRRSPNWASLKSDYDALEAVVNKHATSRRNETEGGGFKQLFNSVLDFNGLVMLRSGACAFQLENCHEVRKVTARPALFVAGSDVTVSISPRGKASEVPLKFP